MHAVILAAGMGTRLGADVPKPLVELAPGLSLLSIQVEALTRLIGMDRIVVVLGHRAQEVMAAHSDLLYVYNPRFRETNTARSLWCALRKLDGDVLWVNGDLYFEAGAARRLLEARPELTRCLVSRGVTGPEEIKYRLDDEGSIVALSKDAANPEGEALGMNIVCARDVPALRRELRAAADSDYFERALERCALAGVRIAPVDAGADFCREIDFPEDLAIVRRHVAQRGPR